MFGVSGEGLLMHRLDDTHCSRNIHELSSMTQVRGVSFPVDLRLHPKWGRGRHDPSLVPCFELGIVRALEAWTPK